VVPGEIGPQLRRLEKMKITPMIINIEGQNIFISIVSLKICSIRKKAPTAMTIIPDVLPPDDPNVITKPIATRSIGQLKIVWSINSEKKPVFLSTRNNPARTSMTPMIGLLCVR
jgi:hypothetical protein